jgi:hypothetical protein
MPAFAVAASIALEKALAAWMELHYAGRARLFGVVTEYMGGSAQCDRPQFTYAGERLYDKAHHSDDSGPERSRSISVGPSAGVPVDARLIPSIRRRLRVDPFSSVRFIDV